jgi:hypothetical protein
MHRIVWIIVGLYKFAAVGRQDRCSEDRWYKRPELRLVRCLVPVDRSLGLATKAKCA